MNLREADHGRVKARLALLARFVFEEEPTHARGTPQDAVDVCTPLDGALEDALVLVGQTAVGANRWYVELPAHVSQTSGHGRQSVSESLWSEEQTMHSPLFGD